MSTLTERILDAFPSGQYGLAALLRLLDIVESRDVPTAAVELALAGRKSFWTTLVARLSGEQRSRIEAVLETIGLKEQRRLFARTLSHGQKQWLEIGMLLMQDPKLLLVDEPVAGMTPQETERTAQLLLSLQGSHSVVVVEHDMEFVRSIARQVTVLHEGHVLAEGTMDAVQSDPRVREVYLGA